ncbi:hypothetical protein EC973_004660 [Apophysomyces ossiformis]|uniref:Cytochrome P450 n=1 Tax=Apophysomyces ossiformis TaxID=679940 RepID=A0A8H7BGN2_9FUNG|nr:hypothetical protein EC973_004660 [Apophysomyces ossiformis]
MSFWFIDHIFHRLSSGETWILGILIFWAVYNLIEYTGSNKQKLNLPPKAAYSLPLFGHTLYVVFNSSWFLDWCTKTYGEVFDLDLIGTTVTVAAGRCAEDVLKADPSDLSIVEGAITDILHLDYVIDRKMYDIGFEGNPSIARKTISNAKIAEYTERITCSIHRGIEDLLIDTDAIVLKDPNHFLRELVAYVGVSFVIGHEVETNAEVIASFRKFTDDLMDNIPIFLIMPRFFHRLISSFLQAPSHHCQVMRHHVLPVIRFRRQQMAEAAARGVPHGLEPNFMQGQIEYTKPDGTQYNDEEIIQGVLFMAFASVHTTSLHMGFALYWLLARPDLRQELEKEIEEVLGAGPITDKGLKKMVLLNNFVHESLRHGVDKLANGKKALKDYTFTNGYQIPKGRTVEVASRQLNMGSNVNPSTPKAMDLQFTSKRQPTTPSRNFVTFGMGKHVCPGRFVAVLEIKLFIITLLQYYDVSTLDKKIPQPKEEMTRVSHHFHN